MAEQRLHSAMAPLDVLTRVELEAELNKQTNDFVRQRYLGVEGQRFPTLTAAGNGATVNLGAINTSDGFNGPEQGDVWMLRRVIVTSSAFLDTAKYILFRGSTPSDAQNSYTSRFLLEGFSLNNGGATTFAQPAVPATGVAAQNLSNQTYTVVINANGATITNVSVNGVTVGTAAGTYVVPAAGSISIAYSVATPTWTWTPTVTQSLGQNVNTGYYPGTKAVLLQPGEQLYAQVFSTTTGNTYTLQGEAIRVPAEMKGKILS